MGVNKVVKKRVKGIDKKAKIVGRGIGEVVAGKWLFISIFRYHENLGSRGLTSTLRDTRSPFYLSRSSLKVAVRDPLEF
tara:strand:- start:857 stop:1093 length:237 start_codon:yes stop_codon:yes gene_type:complete